MGELAALGRDRDNHLRGIPGGVGADEQPTVGISAGVFECERMVDGVEDVFVGDTTVSLTSESSALTRVNLPRMLSGRSRAAAG